MPFFDWFRKKPPPDDISPGGSKYIRHGDKSRSPPAFTEFSTLPLIVKREAVYRQMFGDYAGIYDDEFAGLVPHIDVYVHEPSEGRDFYTLVTGGMSDLPMNVPDDAPKAPRRTEIVFYLPADEAPQREYADFLRTSARFVYDYETWLCWGHTIPNGDPPRPIFPGKPFVSLLFLSPLFKPDSQLAEHLVVDGDPVHFLWIVPITAAEHRLKMDRGTGALEEAFNRARLPFVFDENRASCV
jgi:hypothetical protein